MSLLKAISRPGPFSRLCSRILSFQIEVQSLGKPTENSVLLCSQSFHSLLIPYLLSFQTLPSQEDELCLASEYEKFKVWNIRLTVVPMYYLYLQFFSLC